MNKNYEWIMIGNAWNKYIVYTQLLDKTYSSYDAINDPYISELIKRLKDPILGIKALLNYKTTYLKMGNAFWDLYFLADIGFKAEEIGLENLLEKILSMHDKNFLYVFQEKTTTNHLCIPPIILDSLCKLGYYQDERIKKYIEYLYKRQRLDGGWHCALNKDINKINAKAESCPMATVNVLMLLANFSNEDKRLNKAIDFLLNHWKKRKEPYRPVSFGIGSQFTKLKYPTVKYGILRYIDVLSLYPYARKKKEYKNIMNYIREKAVDNKYFAESISKSYCEFDFAQKKEPSRFITFLIERIEKRNRG